MKTCPVCEARCFDDMDTCFGCMHVFEKEEGETALASDGFPENPEVAASALGLVSGHDRMLSQEPDAHKDVVPASSQTMTVPAIAVVPPRSGCDGERPLPDMLSSGDCQGAQPSVYVALPGVWSVKIDVPDLSRGLTLRCNKARAYA